YRLPRVCIEHTDDVSVRSLPKLVVDTINAGPSYKRRVPAHDVSPKSKLGLWRNLLLGLDGGRRRLLCCGRLIGCRHGGWLLDGWLIRGWPLRYRGPGNRVANNLSDAKSSL